ncbi:DUF6894 family protein [Sinorhizobium arboris]|uniref:DUF6894 family protein n=1 Tax=Sinorhizobium arboris TaxID=76745 RepID=UPI000425929E|nr:hypothetical protein [Sinorhizobium arboris]
MRKRITRDAHGWGNGMQLYFFDLHWDDDCFTDDEGIVHFDEGSALYYAQRIADRIGRDADYGSLKVTVRSEAGVLLASVTPSQGRGAEQDALLGRRSPGLFPHPAKAGLAPAAAR